MNLTNLIEVARNIGIAPATLRDWEKTRFSRVHEDYMKLVKLVELHFGRKWRKNWYWLRSLQLLETRVYPLIGGGSDPWLLPIHLYSLKLSLYYIQLIKSKYL